MDKTIDLQVAVISHIGCVRGNNEDNFFIDGDMMMEDEVNKGAWIEANIHSPYHVLAICDGMGGLEGGENASLITVKELRNLMASFTNLEIKDRIDKCVLTANQLVREDTVRHAGSKGREGTTLALLYLHDQVAHIANVGDSRVYIYRLNTLQQISIDQSRVYRMMLAGQLTREAMRKHPESNKIEQYIGIPEERISKDFVNHASCTLCRGDRFMICSDGLTDLISDETIREILADGTPGETARKLIDYALEHSGKDNVTVIIIDVLNKNFPEPRKSSLTKLTMKGSNIDTTTTTANTV